MESEIELLRRQLLEARAVIVERDKEIERLAGLLRENGIEATESAAGEQNEANELLLPLEVIGIVGSFLEPGSRALTRLASTSKDVHACLAPALYGTVSYKAVSAYTMLPRWFTGPERSDRAR